MARHYKYKKPRRSSITVDRKAHSMQGAWRKATDRTSTLSVADAKALIANPPLCIYCGLIIPWQHFSIDHLTPRSRGGASTPDNLAFVCNVCNKTKGDLLKDEFIALLGFLNGYPRMKESVLSRLRAAGLMFGKRRRR